MNICCGYRGYGMAPHWMGGIPAEGPGAVPPQLELRPAHRQTTSPNVFENLVLDLESALAMGGWSLHREARGNRVIYRAGDRVVAEAVQVPGGFIGTINAMPVRRLHTEYAKGEMQLQQRKMGFGLFDAMTIGGYGAPQEEAEAPSREEVIAATAAAEAAAREAELQMALAQQQRSFNSQIISGFIGASAFAVVMWGIGQAVAKGG